MSNLLILEGPDGGGKTTLSGEFVYHHRTHHGSYKDEPEIAIKYFKSMMRAIMDHGHVLLDRSWLAEPIYGEVYRSGANRIQTPHRRMLDRIALGLNACVVLCYPPLQHCLDTFNSRRDKEMLANDDQLTRVYELYTHMKTSLPVIYYDYTKNNPDHLKNSIMLISDAVPNEGPGIGKYSSRSVLLVGDQSNNQNLFFKRYNVPFISFSRSGCSWWLTEQLEAGGINENRLYWVDALVNGVETDPQFIDEMNPLETVALGDVAAAWLKKHDQPFIKAPHPQYWNRFRAGKPYPLIDIINEALDE